MTVPLADIDFGELLLLVFEAFLLAAWVWICVTLVTDLLRDRELSELGASSSQKSAATSRSPACRAKRRHMVLQSVEVVSKVGVAVGCTHRHDRVIDRTTTRLDQVVERPKSALTGGVCRVLLVGEDSHSETTAWARPEAKMSPTEIDPAAWEQ